MLQKIRYATDSIIFKVLLGLLVISFAIWGVSDVLNGPSSKVVATFSGIDPITYEDFVKARASQIKQYQQQSEQPISEEQIKEMGIDKIVMQSLVTNKLFEFLADKFDLDFSNEIIADFIRKISIFRDENHAFDIDKFKSFLSSQNLSEDEYSENVSNILAGNIIMSSLVGNAYIPDIRTNSIISHMSEMRTVDVVSISLLPKSQNMEKENLKEADLLNFYNENSSMFKTDEVRDICYAKLDIRAAQGNINVTDADIQAYFKENNDEFGSKKLNKVKTAIKSKLQKQRAEEWIIGASKALEDEVAGGATLQEIAAKYKLQRICEKNISTNNIETRADGLLANYSTEIADLGDKEVSYPLDLPKGNGQILLEVVRVDPEQIKPFELVKDKVTSAYTSFLYKQNVLKQLQDFASSASESNFVKDATSIGMNISPTKDYIRANLMQNVSFPSEMLVNIFAAPKGKITGPFITDDSAYIFVVRSISHDKKTKDKITKDSKDNIANKLREGIFEELMVYATNISKMKLNANFNGK